MRRLLIASLLISAHAAAPRSPLDESQLDAVHAQRIEWMKTRAGIPPPGVFQDVRAVFTHSSAARKDLLKAAEDGGVQAIFSPGFAPALESGIVFLPPPAQGLQEIYRRPAVSDDKTLRQRLKQHPDEAFGVATVAQSDLIQKWDEATVSGTATGFAWSDPASGAAPAVAFRNTSTHLLAREFSESGLLTALDQGHAYVAHDWLCDPTGFTFYGANFLGVFEIGDTMPAGLTAGEPRFQAFLPLAAHIKLLRNGEVVAEARDSKISFTAKQPGAYRLEAWLTAGGAELPWIFSNPIYLRGNVALTIPGVTTSGVETHPDVSYAAGDPADAAKHKLDLFLPRGKTNFPLMLFVHGGSWRTGDRTLYRTLGAYFANAGIGVAIPSYRLMPDHPHPAQMEDIAAAFAWMHDNAAKYGADPQRLYVTGHSAGGHLAALLALDPAYLAKFGISTSAIRGVVTMSGVYDVRNMPEYVDAADKALASPLTHVHSSAPKFLISYCQWDYLGLPRQALDFSAALKKAFVETSVIYIPGETHVSEIVSAVTENSPLARAILDFVR